MNVRDLVYLRAVARHTHFGRAADACNISQPALSTQIKRLEDELGVTLFERDNRSVRLTDVGSRIVVLAEEALSVIDTIRQTAEASRDPLSGNFRIGSIPTITPYLVPHFVSQTNAALPRLHMQFREDITERLTAALLDGEIDAAIIATPPSHRKLDSIELFDESFWAIFPREHPLASSDTLVTEQLPADELLLLAEGHCFRDQALDLLQRDLHRDASAIRATSLETLINMVAAGQGITLAPAMALDGGWITDQRISARQLDDHCACRRIYLIFRKSYPRRQLLETLAGLIRDNLPDSVSRLSGNGPGETAGISTDDPN